MVRCYEDLRHRPQSVGGWFASREERQNSQQASSSPYRTTLATWNGIGSWSSRPCTRKFHVDTLFSSLVDNNNYWLVALYEKEIQVYKKAGGAYTSLTTVPFAFQPNTTYPIKVIVADDLLTVFVSGKQQAQVKMDAFQNATKFGLRDNSAPNRQPSWGNFQATSP